MRTGEREAHAPLICNRTRQAMIAKELIEIIPGREAI
jgi:F0F1-type ATP synthase gamma subunit